MAAVHKPVLAWRWRNAGLVTAGLHLADMDSFCYFGRPHRKRRWAHSGDASVLLL
jgi:hypothetical protein